MKKRLKKWIASVLTATMLFTIASPALAAEEELYLSDIRVVYAEDLKGAKKQVETYNADLKAELEAEGLSDLYDEQKLQLFEYNLNEGTEAQMAFIGLGEEPHAYVAYSSTNNIENAITDVAVMDMNGGYTEGNLPAMLEESRAEYEEFAAYYITAINYFKSAYEACDPMAQAAYRQLNFYYDPDSDKKLGDVLFDDISTDALATILLEGNINILENMRALIAMGVSYNESGLSYLETVEQTAAQYDADPAVFENENWYEITINISSTFQVLADMIEEYNSVRDTLDYSDDEFTEEELQYLEYASMIQRLEETTYINGQSLADFIYHFDKNYDSYLTLYPLVAAMNPGQMAMTELFRFYDVIRYSVTDLTAEEMESQIAELEEQFADGLDIYIGVDRDLYDATFAVTTKAERLAATYGRNIGAEVFGSTNNIVSYVVSTAAMVGNTIVLVKNLNAGATSSVAGTAMSSQELFLQTHDVLFNGTFTPFDEVVRTLAKTYHIKLDAAAPLYDQAQALLTAAQTKAINASDYSVLFEIQDTMKYSQSDQAFNVSVSAKAEASGGISAGAAVAIFGGISFAILATNIGMWIYNYYNPELTDIPLAMVDLIESEEGDRYLFYDAATMLEPDDDGNYHAACLNAFEGKGWNAIYYTKSYEAGNALLADFNISYNRNRAENGYIPVHKFGDNICFNLNKHAFGDELQIYLSVAQSDKQKAGDTEVPEVVGSMVNIGSYMLAAGIGIVVGMGIMAGIRRSKKQEEE